MPCEGRDTQEYTEGEGHVITDGNAVATSQGAPRMMGSLLQKPASGKEVFYLE